MRTNRLPIFVTLISALVLKSCDTPKTNDLTSSQTSAHFHHVHLNVSSIDSTRSFYEVFFGASKILYRNKSKALFTEKSFLLLDSVTTKPKSNVGSSLWHIGWAGVDGDSEFQWRVNKGIKVQTPLTGLIADLSRPMDTTYYMYFWGPDLELIEVYTGSQNHRFEHVHLLASNINATTNWFKENLGLQTIFNEAISWHGLLINIIRVDNVNIIVFAKPTPETEVEWWPKESFKPTDGTSIDHIGFSYEKIEPIFEKLKSSRIEIVREIRLNPVHGLSSFFIRGPDNILIEIVNERPVPEGIW